MKFFPLFLITSGLASAGMIPLGEHVDLTWTWNISEQKWELRLNGDSGIYTPDEAFLPLSDKPRSINQPSISGARISQTSNLAFSFTGVAPGENIWGAFFSGGGVGEAYPGFANGQTSSVIAPYIETDPRLLPQPQTLAQSWITSQISSVYHDGALPPKFSMWTGSSSNPAIWASTSNGQENNLYLVAAGSHDHMNWLFGATGIYRIGMKASAFLGANQTLPTGESDEVKVTFTVGPVAFWQARNFSAPELEMPEITAMGADPDGDGEKNIIEYAFGTDPNGSATPLAPGLGAPTVSLESSSEGIFQVISFPRRKALQLTNPLIYTPQFSDDLSIDSWVESGSETVAEFIGDQAGLNAEWEKVEFRRQVTGASAQRAFARVKVAFMNE